MASSSFPILWSSVVSCGARSDESPARLASASAPSFAFSAATSFCNPSRPVAFEACCAASALSILPCSFCSMSPILASSAAASGTEPPSLAVSASAFSDSSRRVTRDVSSETSAGVSTLRSSNVLTRASSAPSASASPAGGGADFELGETALERGQVRRIRRAKRDHVPCKGQADHADQAAEQPCGEMGHKALELGRARPWRRAFGPLRLRSFGVLCVGLDGRIRRCRLVRCRTDCGRCHLVRRRIDGHFGRGAFDSRRRALPRTSAHMVAKCVSHDAYRRSSNRGPYEDAASGEMRARISSSRGRAATITLAFSGSTACATAAERQ